jgi:thiamine biosynthesis lipoprotein ApbE
MGNVKAEHSRGMIQLRRSHLDPAGGKPQAEDVALLTVAQAKALAADLLDCAGVAAEYKSRTEHEEIRRLEAEIKVRQERLAELQARL